MRFQPVSNKHLYQLLLISGLFFYSTISVPTDISFEDSVNYLYQAKKSGEALPLLSEALPGISIDQAYTIQSLFVKKQLKTGERVRGFKAGLTSTQSQQKYKLDHAVAGVLFSSGDLLANKPILKEKYKKLMV